MNTDSARIQMVSQQVRAWEVLDPRVLDAMSVVSRDRFTPATFAQVAFADTRIPLPHGQEMLAPKVVGRLLQALALEPSDSVLEVGTGSGYMTACLLMLVRKVASIDIFPDLVDTARDNLAGADTTALTLEAADAFEREPGARYDAIAVTGSLPVYDRRFERQLAVGGRLFVIVGEPPVMDARVVTRVGEEAWVSDSVFETVVPPLINAPRPRRFAF